MVSIKCPTCGSEATCEYYDRITQIGQPGTPWRTIRCQRRPAKEACKVVSEPFSRPQENGGVSVSEEDMARFDRLRQFSSAPLAMICKYCCVTDPAEVESVGRWFRRAQNLPEDLARKLLLSLSAAEREREEAEAKQWEYDLAQRAERAAYEGQIEEISDTKDEEKYPPEPGYQYRYGEDVIAIIASLAENHLTAGEVCRELTRKGIRPVGNGNGAWSLQSVQSICRRNGIAIRGMRQRDEPDPRAIEMVREGRLRGKSLKVLLAELQASGLPSPGHGGKRWQLDDVNAICRTEKLTFLPNTVVRKEMLTLVKARIQEGASFSEISDELNNSGARNRYGHSYTGHAVRQICLRHGIIYRSDCRSKVLVPIAVADARAMALLTSIEDVTIRAVAAACAQAVQQC